MLRCNLPRVLLAVALTLGVGTLTTVRPAGAVGVPYRDPASNGSIGLCNAANQQVTSGSITDVPLAVKAVSTVAAPSPYNGPTRTAILLAYQPRQGLVPGEWSGQALTASSRYSNPQVPMVQATSRDASLKTFLVAFPASDDGFVQLRMYFGAANEPASSSSYPTLDLQVTGSTWHAIGGAAVDCSAGTAESLENIVLPSTTTSSTTTTAVSSTSSTRSPSRIRTTTTATRARGASSTGWILTGAVIVGLAAGIGLSLRSRRRRARR
jgi:hypothetical protein